LGMRQTLEHFRNDVWMPKLIDRNVYDNWLRLGGRDLRVGAKETAMKILKEHSAKPLEDEQKKDIEKIVKECSEC
ncbi:MAG: trimethylamine methyltransferase family protein, partial [Methanobacteriota archaeon]